jgi:hypothetical protein
MSTRPPPRLVRDEVRWLRLLRELDVPADDAVPRDPVLVDGVVPTDAVPAGALPAEAGALARAAIPQTLQ